MHFLLKVVLYLHTYHKRQNYGENIQRGTQPPPQLLRLSSGIARRRRTDRGDRTFRHKARPFGIQFAIDARRTVAPRAPRRIMEDRKAHAAGDRPRRCLRAHRGEDRTQFRIRIRYRTVFRGHACRPRPATAVPGLCREFPGMVGTDFGHAPAGNLDNAGRCGIRRVAATLQPAYRQRSA